MRILRALLFLALAPIGCGDADEPAARGDTKVEGTLDGASLSLVSAAYGVSLHQATPVDRSLDLVLSADPCDSFPPPMPQLTVFLEPGASGEVAARGTLHIDLQAGTDPVSAEGTLQLDRADVTGVPEGYASPPFTGVTGTLAGTLHLELRSFDLATGGGSGDIRGLLDGPFWADHCRARDESHFE